MVIDISEEPLSAFGAHASISIAFDVDSVYNVEGDRQPFSFVEQKLKQPYRKDYDAIEDPSSLPARFNTSNWGLLGAYMNGIRVGGAILAFNTPGILMLEGRDDLAVIWDLRVAEEARRSGIGTVLFGAAESWAKQRGCAELKIETQNINVPACNFYSRHGCELREVNRKAYANFPGEAQLLWYKSLT